MKLTTLYLFAALVFFSTALWAQKPVQVPQKFPLAAHVTASRSLYRLALQPVPAVATLRVFAIIKGKRYELDNNTFSAKAKLLHLGYYPAELEYRALGKTGEFMEKCLLKMPDGKIIKFTVTGISESTGQTLDKVSAQRN